jgi:hypothetical protein
MGVADIIPQWQQQSAASLPTAFIATGVLLLLVPKLRLFVLDALETVIATFLLLILIGAVLGLPFGEHLGPTLVAAVSIQSAAQHMHMDQQPHAMIVWAYRVSKLTIKRTCKARDDASRSLMPESQGVMCSASCAC